MHGIDLSNTQVTDEDLGTFGVFPMLEGVMLQNTDVSLTGIRRLPLTVLRLDLGKTRIGDADCEELAGMTHIQSFSFEGGDLTDAGVASLCRKQNLKELNLQKNPITDQAIEAILQCPRLQSVILNYCDQLSSPAIARLSQLNQLQYLHLAATQIEDPALAEIAGRCPLTELGLIDCTSISDAGLQSLGNCPTLKTVYLDGTRVSTAAVLQLHGHPGLRTLFLRDNPTVDVEALRAELPAHIRIVSQW
ncbi:MAG: hypothetical protein KDA96_21270 [Planctomycetaceae bacterium]|nr:hypothetical protein [Planctomycetaceae bacterium]